jgi:aminodeoxyfutalosine deaminase
MSLTDYIRAMPKVEIAVQLHGAMKPDNIAIIADQNEIADNVKHFNSWLGLVRQPDFSRLDEILRMACSWILQPDDLKYLAYDLATTLHKQNVRYAEVGIDPTLYTGLAVQPDELLAILNDGRDRAERAWGIKIAWIIMMPREEPRRAEDLVRWATSPSSRRAGVVGVGLGGHESAMPVGQFERPFKMAEKREVPRLVRAGDEQGAEGVLHAVETLAPTRLIDGRGLLESADALGLMVQQDTVLCINLTRAVKQGWVNAVGDYPLRALYDANVKVALVSDLPAPYDTSLAQEYIQAVETGLVSLEELEEMALNAVRATALEDSARQEMVAQFADDYVKLRALYLE